MTTVKPCNDCDKTTKTSCGNCCKTCPDCPNCYDLGIEKIKEYITGIDNKILEHSDSKICKSNWGYGCNNTTDSDFEKLMIFKDYINHFYQSLRLNCSSGICPDEIQKVLEQVSKLISLDSKSLKQSSSVIIDDSKYELWVEENPYCIDLEDWEKYLTSTDAIVQIQVNSIKSCELDLKFIIDDYYETFDYNLNVELKVCKHNYKILISKHNCNFDFRTYIELLKCDLTHKSIANLLSCDIQIGYSSKNVCPIINNKNLTKIDIKNINQTSSCVDVNSILTNE